MNDFLKKNIKWIVSTILMIIIPLITYHYTNNELKQIVISASETIDLISSGNANDLKVSLNGKELTNPRVTRITIKNTGNVPLKKSDFQEDLEILNNIKSYSVLISNSEPENLGIRMVSKDEKIIISPFLLNPEEHFTIQLITDYFTPSCKILARLTGFEIKNEIKVDKKISGAQWVLIIIYYAFALFFASSLQILIKDKNNGTYYFREGVYDFLGLLCFITFIFLYFSMMVVLETSLVNFIIIMLPIPIAIIFYQIIKSVKTQDHELNVKN